MGRLYKILYIRREFLDQTLCWIAHLVDYRWQQHFLRARPDFDSYVAVNSRPAGSNESVHPPSNAVLEVPGGLVPAEVNYPLNLRYPDFAKISIGKPQALITGLFFDKEQTVQRVCKQSDEFHRPYFNVFAA